MILPYRKPLIIIGPKILLRHPLAASPLENFGPGTYFQSIIYNRALNPDKIKKVYKIKIHSSIKILLIRLFLQVENIGLLLQLN